jgi:hypothetical protein
LTCFYNADKVFLGMALIGVANEVDAERIRLEYSGQLIDNSGSSVHCRGIVRKG